MKRFIVLLLMATALSATPEAPTAIAAKAKQSSNIRLVGVKSFDKVFREARDLSSTLTDASQRRKTARLNLNTALGLKSKTTFEDALRELRSRAKGKVKVSARGGKPKLQATDAVPSNVQAGIDAANAAVDDYTRLLSDLASMPESCAEMARKARQLSAADLRSELSVRSVSDVRKRVRQVKKVRSNLQTMQKMPNRSQRLMSNLRGDVASVQSVFSR